MVTFSCEVCNESMLKKKADQHTQRCYGASFTCIDCSKTFSGNEYRNHTSCITEDQKYQGALYKPKKKQQMQQQQQQQKQQHPNGKEQPKEESKEEKKASQKESKKADKKDKVSKKTDRFDLKKHIGQDLYKVLKKLSKDEKKELMKKIVISEGGSLELK